MMGIGTMVVAGCLHFYFSRRGGGGSGGGEFSSSSIEYHSPEMTTPNIIITSSDTTQSSPQSFSIDLFPVNGDGGGGSIGSSKGDGSGPTAIISSFFLRLVDVIQKVIHFPAVAMGSIQSTAVGIIAFPSFISEKKISYWDQFYERLMTGVLASIGNVPSQLGSSTMALASAGTLWVSSKSSAIVCIIAGTFQNILEQFKGSWSHFAVIIAEYVRRMRGSNGVSPTL